MTTQYLTASAADCAAAAALWQQGEVVAFPTETVYGLGAAIGQPAAVAKIYAAKGRPTDNPLIAHIASLAMVSQLARNVPESFYHLADHFWPGPLTMVVSRQPSVPDIATAGLPTIGIRWPAHPVAQQLITALGAPVAAPSANLSGRPSPTTANHVLADLDGKIAAVVDGGACTVGIESTIIDLSSARPVILRPGAITAADLAAVLGEPVAETTTHSSTVPQAPGMKYRHYAPQVPVRVVDSWEQVKQEPEQAVFILANTTPAKWSGPLPLPLNAATLFARFREAELAGLPIVVVLDAAAQAQAGLMNRLYKASSATV